MHLVAKICFQEPLYKICYSSKPGGRRAQKVLSALEKEGGKPFRSITSHYSLFLTNNEEGILHYLLSYEIVHENSLLIHGFSNCICLLQTTSHLSSRRQILNYTVVSPEFVKWERRTRRYSNVNLNGESERKAEKLKTIRILGVVQRLLSIQRKEETEKMERGRLEEKLSMNRSSYSRSLDKF